jgi:iron(III) transport system substrate-binding protein
MRQRGVRIGVATIVAMVAASVLACARPPVTGTSDTAQVVRSSAQERFNEQHKELIAQAQREGGPLVTTFTSGRGAGFAPWLEVFKREYGIDYVLSAGRGYELQDQVLAEYAAGRRTTDIWGSGQLSHIDLAKAGTLSPFEEWLVDPDVKDPSLWKGGRFWWADPEQKYAFIYSVSPRRGTVTINTNMVRPEEIKTYTDLLNPKWKDKMATTNDPILDEIQSTVFLLARQPQGRDFLQRLYTEIRPKVIGDEKLLLDSVARGTYALAWGGDETQAAEMKALGLPIAQVKLADFVDWGIGSASLISVFKDPPHPAAARLLVNWLLSEAGWEARVNLIRTVPDLPTTLEEGVPLHTKRTVDHLEDRLPDDLYLFATDPNFESVVADSQRWFRQLGRTAGY